MMDNEIEYWEGKFDTYGFDPRTVGWGSVESQKLRFRILKEGMKPYSNDDSVMDIGAGLCDLYHYLDLSPEQYIVVDRPTKVMDEVRTRYPELVNFRLGELSEIDIGEADWVVCSGAFAFENIEKNLKELIEKCWVAARKGFLFNCLSQWAGQEHMSKFSEDEFNDPIKVVEHCRTYTNRLSLRHDYMDHDFTVYMYR